ncbi:hypothetical protein [Escherichia coli]|uniref:hypothetical protein n=1 Tax=Escherichia coli TaxID=562 RepID=UPI001CBCC2B9|nr:hypothetical protein [Escherichia coli]MCD9134020.1 hypothetical protein [Escherichia coli]
MVKYFRLRLAQWLLIISVALPVALAFSAQVSATGFIDSGTFGMAATGCLAVMWGGLALYTRDIDRQRHLPDVLMTDVPIGDTTVSMKRNEKADIVWQVLQDDALYRKQVRMWGNGLCLMAGKAFIWLPAVLLTSICLMFWFVPGDVVRLIKNWRSRPGLRRIHGCEPLIHPFCCDGGLAGMIHMIGKKAEELVCFSAAYQEGVHRYARQQREITERPDTEATTE